MSALFNVITGAVDQAAKEKLEASPCYRKAKRELEVNAERAATVEKISIVVGLSAIFVMTTLAIRYFEDDRAALGGAVMAATVPLSILSYDCYQASENFRSQVYEDPTKLMVLSVKNVPINSIELRKCLLKGTICFEPFLEGYKQTYMDILIEEN
jgi:hypothetical protein